MNRSKINYQILRSVLLVFVMTFVLNIPDASGHSYTLGYYRGTSPPTFNRDWMLGLPDQLRVSELSLPGTHDTMADKGGGSVRTQTMDLREQLDSGIRVLDIRLRSIDNVFTIHHQATYLNHVFGEVLSVTTDFLRQHSGETIVMRVKNERPNDEKSTMSFEEIFARYVGEFSSFIWVPPPGACSIVSPTLGEARGKIVFLQEFESEACFGLDWNSLKIQDWYNPPVTSELYNKWEGVKTHITNANSLVQTNTFINFLSASTGAEPFFWASGHFISAEGADRNPTGKTSPGCGTSCWPDLPRVTCVGDLCTILYEGINILTYKYLNGILIPWKGTAYNTSNIKFVGWIMMDFPGGGLIDTIVNYNPWNWPPVADAGGPYVVNEGSAVNFNASASTDKDDININYRWDFDNDGTWDTSFFTSATENFTWDDDYTGTARVEVSDNKHSDIAEVSVTVNNVNPTAIIDQIADGEEFILTNLVVNFHGSFTDPGADTFGAVIDWKDGNKTDFPFATTSPTISAHFYTAVGDYNVLFTVTDDDSGVGNDSASVKILSPAEAASEAIDDLKLIDDRNIRRALVDLEGANNGRGKGGALDHFEANDVNAALVKIEAAIEDLIAAEEGDSSLDLTEAKELLTIIARSATVGMILDAEAAVVTSADQAKVDQANVYLDEGIVLQEAGDYLGAVSKFQDAVRQAQEVLKAYGLLGAAGAGSSTVVVIYGLVVIVLIAAIALGIRWNRNRKQT